MDQIAVAIQNSVNGIVKIHKVAILTPEGVIAFWRILRAEGTWNRCSARGHRV
jgi:hypothetical protein